MTAPTLLLLGPPQHGVTRYGRDLAAAVRDLDDRTEVVAVETVPDAVEAARRHRRIHLHVTDKLLGRTPAEAADAVELLAAQTVLTVTAHDLPQASDGTGLEPRVAGYGRIFRSAHAAVVNSDHEVRLASEYLAGAPVPHAIPLGVETTEAPHLPIMAADGGDLVVLIAGYIYPGKGHAPAITAARAAVDALQRQGHHVGEPVVRALGGPSPGHEADVRRLTTDAEAIGVRFEVTGFLSDEAFAARMRDVGVPVAAHEHVSASRSMLDWVAAGRRPLVVDSRYAAEMDALRPGTMTRYLPETLADRLVEAWLDPALTRLDPEASLAPTMHDVARQYLDWWDAVEAA